MDCLILGAGLMQKPAILSAKELGFKVVVVDGDENAVCVPLADEFFHIDLKAKEEILDLAKKLKEKDGLAAVFTAGTDFSASVAYVCNALNLPSHSYEAAINASVKTKMRQCFEKMGVPSPKFLQVTKADLENELFAAKAATDASSVSDASFTANASSVNTALKSSLIASVLQKMDFPLVVKPVDNMGARGCRMVRSQIEFLPAVKIAVQASRSGVAIVEEYMEGSEFSIDSLVYDGTMTITGFAQRHIFYPPYFIEMGHTMPATLDKKIHDELISVFALGVKALGLTCGAAKADIKYTKNGPMIGEIAGRLSGGYMSGWTYPYASDLNLTKQALLIAAGKEPSALMENRIPVDYDPGEFCRKICKSPQMPFELYEVECKRTSAERAWISIPGTVEYMENIADYTDKAVFDVLPRSTVSLGADVDFPRNNVQKCGNVICVSHNKKIACDAASDAVSNIFITLQPNNAKTDRFLSEVYDDDEYKFPPSAYPDFTSEEKQKFEESVKNLCEIHDGCKGGFIAKNESVAKYEPEIFKTEKYINAKDWNYNTISETLQKFDVLRSNHPALNIKDFFHAIMRGGLQAAVYYSDSIGAKK